MDHNTPSSSSRKSLNTERLMGYANEPEAPLAMPISDYSGRSSRSSLSRSPLSPMARPSGRKSHSTHRRTTGIRQGLKALLSPITPGRKKRNVLDTRSTRQTRKSLSPKLFGNSPKTAGGRKKYLMNKLAIHDLDDDEDEADSIDSRSPLPRAPKRKLSKASLINTLAITNLDDEDDDIDDDNIMDHSRRSPSRRGGRRSDFKKSLNLSEIFTSKNGLDDDEEEETGPSALDQWREQRKMAMSDDHVCCRTYQGNKNGTATTSKGSSHGIRRIFSSSDNNVRYSIRKDDAKKPDGSFDLAMLILDEMEDSDEFTSKDF